VKKTAAQLEAELTEALAKIWKQLTPSQRVTLLQELGPVSFDDHAAVVRAGLQKHGHFASPSGSARHALGRRGLLEIGQTITAPTSAAGFYTPRKVTTLGRAVAEHGLALLDGRA
jgi:hypothetical protein